ncbi:UNVERIFIED_CONTAM: hypothetical protein RMT77_019408 [Armadillidium vulgare]
MRIVKNYLWMKKVFIFSCLWEAAKGIVDGGWSSWSPATSCTSSSCGSTYKYRTCDNPPPGDGGEECLKQDDTRGMNETSLFKCTDEECYNSKRFAEQRAINFNFNYDKVNLKDFIGGLPNAYDGASEIINFVVEVSIISSLLALVCGGFWFFITLRVFLKKYKFHIEFDA